MKDSIIEEIINQLFTAEVFLVGDPKKATAAEHFWVISGDQGPRWIIPHNPVYGLPVLQQWRPYGAVSSLKWTTLKWVYGLGQLHRFTNVKLIGIAGADSTYWQHLGYGNSRSLIPIIYVGTPGATRKAVATLLEKETGEIVGVAKLPLGAFAQANILREAEVLTHLASELPGLAPKCLFTDPQKGLMLQEALPGTPMGRGLHEAHIQWLASLHHAVEKISIQTQADALVQQVNAVSTIEEDDKEQIKKAIQMLRDSTPLPMTLVHGDFAPWNLKWCNGDLRRTLVAIDWEDAKTNGLPLYDLFHHQYMQAYLFNTRKSVLTDIWNNPIVKRYLQSLKIMRSQFEQLALYYLIDMWLQSAARHKTQDANFFRAEALLLMEKRL